MFDPTRPVLAVLNNAAGFLRGALGKSLQVRMIPRLRFHYDETIVRGNRMAELIHQAISEDARSKITLSLSKVCARAMTSQ
jgi:ribosome-binding factor A